ncbi:MAG: DUF3179 domain-containing (seleno)protein [Ardenticatenaceae bacterium]
MIFLLLALLLVACGAGNEQAGPSADPAAAQPTADVDESSTAFAAEVIANETEETVTSDSNPEPTATSEPEATATSEPEATATSEPEATATSEREATRPATSLIEDSSGELPPHLASRVQSWGTDWSRHTVLLDELFSGGPPRDGIPPIDEPIFISIEEAAQEVDDLEPVVVYEHNGDARAYPLAILIWHEIVNDEVGGQPVTITYCPLCNTAIAFDRNFGEQLLDFGTSGLLRNSDLVMWDRQTETLWQQATGEGIVGELAGQALTFLPASLLNFSEFKETYPDGQLLSRETGHSRGYGTNPYAGYDNVNSQPFLFQGTPDERLPALERVVGLIIGDSAVAYPFSSLSQAGVVNDELNGQPVAVFYSPDTVSALDASVIKDARSIGSAVSYNPIVDGQPLTFELRDGHITDTKTGSQWDATGRATNGPLAGTQLDVLPHANHFWFAFAAFYPNVTVWEDS